MKSLSTKLSELIDEKKNEIILEKDIISFEEMIKRLEDSGLVKKPNYDLPMVDTLGKRFYSSLNK